MNILIVGGTNFIGPHLVEAFTDRGHRVTLFNRGKTDPERFAELELLRGDREAGDYAALRGLDFDAVIDLSAYFPRAVRQLRAVLGDPGHYVFVSTLSVFSDFTLPGMKEDAELAVLDNPEVETVTRETYGALKAACEAEARRFPSFCIVRPGLVVGPGDPTDRFTYWVARAQRGGQILTPPLEDPMQFVDVRDLALFLADAAHDRLEGAFNAVHPAGFVTTRGVLQAAVSAAATGATLREISASTAAAFGLRGWVDFPAWLPSEGPTAGFGAFDSSKAARAGLHARPIEETVRDTLAWWSSLPDDRRNLQAGLDPATESSILQALKQRDDVEALWDDKYSDEELRFGDNPNAFMTAVIERVPEGGRVLCIGDGEGRNGVWLAERGYHVTSIEPSDVGIGKLRRLADKRGVELEVVHGVMPSEALVSREFDAVVSVFVHMPEDLRRFVHRQVRALLTRGGVVILEAYTPAQLTSAARGGPKDAGLLYDTQLLADDFDGFEIEILDEVVAELDEGVCHQGASNVVRLLARKP